MMVNVKYWACKKAKQSLTSRCRNWSSPALFVYIALYRFLCISYAINRFLFCFPANLVLHRTIERIHVGKKYGDIPRGIFIVRGENVVLLGEIVSNFNVPNEMLYSREYAFLNQKSTYISTSL